MSFRPQPAEIGFGNDRRGATEVEEKEKDRGESRDKGARILAMGEVIPPGRVVNQRCRFRDHLSAKRRRSRPVL